MVIHFVQMFWDLATMSNNPHKAGIYVYHMKNNWCGLLWVEFN